MNREAKRESGESAESENALSSDPLGRNEGQQLSSERNVMDLTVPIDASVRKQQLAMESHRTHQLTSYDVQARPGAYIADSARGAILQTDHVLRF